VATAEQLIPADHPALPGHFPGDPVVPGALLLAWALQSIEAGAGVSLSPCRIKSAKFPSPARPGDRITIAYAPTGAGAAMRFSCTVGGRDVLRGEVACAGRSTPA
jgi:3-hydroxymyristoyl/3-hydroxydecanoyl-(acyl carrier protein) dehydratase